MPTSIFDLILVVGGVVGRKFPQNRIFPRKIRLKQRLFTLFILNRVSQRVDHTAEKTA